MYFVLNVLKVGDEIQKKMYSMYKTGNRYLQQKRQ